MEVIFRSALKSNSTYLRDEHWGFYMPEQYRRSPGVLGKALVIQHWPTQDMLVITTAARTILEAGDCNSVVLECVLDDECVQQLLGLGWKDYYSILSLTL